MYADTGVFVCFEGGEGSGKSTQSRLLGDWLGEQGHDVVLTFEPGDTPVGQELRRIVLSPETGELSDRTETLLYAADKAEHVHAVVRPALDRGAVVITDRYVDSTLAYQGAGRPLEVGEVERVARWATGDLRPHLTVVLDLDPATGLRRFDGPRPDRAGGPGLPRAGAGGVPADGRRRPRPLPRPRRPRPGRRPRGRRPRPPGAAAPAAGSLTWTVGARGGPSRHRLSGAASRVTP